MALCFARRRIGDAIKGAENMKTKTSIFGLSAAALLLGALALATAVTANAQSEQSPNGLEGTWRVKVVQYNCANPAITFPLFVRLAHHASRFEDWYPENCAGGCGHR
jgi:hypothetical protein